MMEQLSNATINPNGLKFDAIAIAPYFAQSIGGDLGGGYNADPSIQVFSFFFFFFFFGLTHFL
jgi:hypothetical protein